MKEILSRNNPLLKHVRQVRDGKETNEIFCEGARLAEEALRSMLSVRNVFVTEKFTARESGRRIVTECEKRGIAINLLGNKTFDSIADTESSQGIVLIAERPAHDPGSVSSRLTKADVLPLAIYLSVINNPSNIGAIVRTAEAAGVAGIIMSPNSADAFSAKAIRASMGSIFRLPVVAGVSFREAADWAVAESLVLTGAAVSGKGEYYTADWSRRRLLVLGSEAHGLDKEVLAGLEETIRIPMASHVESLNLAVACGILVFEAKRQFAASVEAARRSN
ncbi:MAG: RNA methyltransferase [Acidobacteriota bacterium]